MCMPTGSHVRVHRLKPKLLDERSKRRRLMHGRVPCERMRVKHGAFAMTRRMLTHEELVRAQDRARERHTAIHELKCRHSRWMRATIMLHAITRLHREDGPRSTIILEL